MGEQGIPADGVTIEVATRDLHQTRVTGAGAAAPLCEGEALVEIASFAITANNITYAAFGDLMGYWQFFPSHDPAWGRVPVWGHGTVVASTVAGLEEGRRVYGYFPMSSHLRVSPTHVSASGFVDGAEHRAALPPVYNRYELVDASGAGTDDTIDETDEAFRALLRPLFVTSFLIDDWLDDRDVFGAESVLVSSASSKTSLALAFLLRRRGHSRVVGLTSERNLDAVRRVGYYDDVVTYGSLADAGVTGDAVLVDMAGDPAVLGEVHHLFADRLRHSCRVGATHWDTVGAPMDELPGPSPQLFFAPDHVVRRQRDWGPGGFDERLGDAWKAFVGSVTGWMTVRRAAGTDETVAAYTDVLDGRVPPDVGVIASLAPH